MPDWATIQANIPYDQYKETVLDILQPKTPAKGKRPGRDRDPRRRLDGWDEGIAVTADMPALCGEGIRGSQTSSIGWRRPR